MLTNKLSKDIYKLCYRAKTNTTEVAEALNTHQSTISRMLNYRAINPMLIEIAEYLGYDITITFERRIKANGNG